MDKQQFILTSNRKSQGTLIYHKVQVLPDRLSVSPKILGKLQQFCCSLDGVGMVGENMVRPSRHSIVSIFSRWSISISQHYSRVETQLLYAKDSSLVILQTPELSLLMGKQITVCTRYLFNS